MSYKEARREFDEAKQQLKDLQMEVMKQKELIERAKAKVYFEGLKEISKEHPIEVAYKDGYYPVTPVSADDPNVGVVTFKVDGTGQVINTRHKLSTRLRDTKEWADDYAKKIGKPLYVR